MNALPGRPRCDVSCINFAPCMRQVRPHKLQQRCRKTEITRRCVNSSAARAGCDGVSLGATRCEGCVQLGPPQSNPAVDQGQARWQEGLLYSIHLVRRLAALRVALLPMWRARMIAWGTLILAKNATHSVHNACAATSLAPCSTRCSS